MAQVAPSGKGGRRSYDANINLIPYIDLMTTIITFLMMAAVWTQIAALEIQNGAGEEEAPVVEQENPPKVIHVFMTANGLGVFEEGGIPLDLPNVDNKLDFGALAKSLEQLKQDRPDRNEITISVDDGVKHGEVIKVMDMATNLGLLNVTMKPLSLS